MGIRIEFGVAGCGKTQTGADFISKYNFIDGIYATYNTHAVDEFFNRIGIDEEDRKNYKNIGTIHGIANREIKKYVSSKEELVNLGEFSKQHPKYFSIRNPASGNFFGRLNFFLNYYDLQRINKPYFDKEKGPLNPHMKEYRKFIELYEEFKATTVSIDFVDQVLTYLKYGEPIEGKQAFCLDEAQDCSPGLWACFWKMSEKIRKDGEVLILLDPAQRIYSHFGSTVDEITNLAKSLPRENIVNKNISYRLNKTGVKHADFYRKKLHLPFDIPTVPKGEDVRFKNPFSMKLENLNKEFKRLVAEKKSIFLLARTNDFARIYYPWLFFMGLRFTHVKKNYIETFPSNKRYVFPYYAAYKRLLIKRENRGVELNDPKLIQIKTIHKAKGEEADYVFLLNNISRSVRNNLFNNKDRMEEYRILYTAASRAKKRFYVIMNQRSWKKTEYRYSYNDLGFGVIK